MVIEKNLKVEVSLTAALRTTIKLLLHYNIVYRTVALCTEGFIILEPLEVAT